MVEYQSKKKEGKNLGSCTIDYYRVALKADYYLQRLSVLLRQRKTAKVQGIVQRVRDALFGGPVATMDEGFDDDEDRVSANGGLTDTRQRHHVSSARTRRARTRPA